MSRRVTRAVGDAIRAGREGAPAVRKYAGAEALAREIGYAMDVASELGKVYAIAQLAPRLLDTLRELHLTPATGDTANDPLTELLRELSAPPVLDTEG